MLRRYRGGYISATKKTTTLSSASGMFNLAYQASNSANWPGLNNPAYQQLIDNFIGTRYYISPTGSDTNSGLNESAPLATYNQFRALTSAITSSVMCIFLQGTYSLSTIVSNASFSECCFTDENYQRVFVCKTPNATIFNWTADNGKRDCAPFYFRNINSAFYGGIINRNNNGRTLNYSTAFFNQSTVGFAGKVYNTVIAEVNANAKWSLSYNNASWSGTQGAYYCTFAVGAAALGSYSGTATFPGDYCAGNYSVTNSFPLFTNYVNANGSMNPTTYQIAGTSGVYNGTYAWPTP